LRENAVALEPWPDLAIIGVVIGAVAITLLTLYTMKEKTPKKQQPVKAPPETSEVWPSRIEHSVTTDDAKKAKEELRTLDVEREILSYAIRRLYEAEAEGKITEEERESLARGYKDRMLNIKDLISRSESVVALHELEAMQEDLIKLFSDRFDDINQKVEDLRSHLDFKPVKTAPIPTRAPPSAPPETGKERGRRRPKAPKKSEAEKRIDEIRAEVEKVLERLGQIEVEA
jgi:hypothetical protein